MATEKLRINYLAFLKPLKTSVEKTVNLLHRFK
jgi:hypothetical protein